MFKTITKIISMAVIGIWMTGCGPSMLDKNWGRSFQSAKQNQILNPHAGKDMTPVEGLNGPSAERIINKHHSGKQVKSK